MFLTFKTRLEFPAVDRVYMCTAPRKEQFVIFSEEHDYRVIKSFSDCNREIRIKIDSLNIDITKRC